MNVRTLTGWTGLAVLSVLGAFAVFHSGGDTSQVRATSESTAAAKPVKLTRVMAARTIQTVDTPPTIEVRATRL